MADAATSSWVDWAPCLEEEVILSTEVCTELSLSFGPEKPADLQITGNETETEKKGFSQEQKQAPSQHATPAAQRVIFLQKSEPNQQTSLS